VTVLYGVRLLAVLAALRVDLELLQALVIALSAPLSAAAGVFPSGIGLAEGISGLLAPLVAVPVAAGVAATGVNRIAGLAVTAPLAMLFAARAPGGDAAIRREMTSLSRTAMPLRRVTTSLGRTATPLRTDRPAASRCHRHGRSHRGCGRRTRPSGPG
jgi:hypothetical protein